MLDPEKPEDACPECRHSISVLHDDIGCAVCSCTWNLFDEDDEAQARRLADG